MRTTRAMRMMRAMRWRAWCVVCARVKCGVARRRMTRARGSAELIAIVVLKGDNTKGARADEDCFGFDWFLMYTWLICDCMAMMKSNSTKARERELRGSGANEEDVAKGAKGG